MNKMKGLFVLAASLFLASCQNNQIYQTGEIHLENGVINMVEIDWVGGNIDIEQSSDGKIYAQQEGGVEKGNAFCYKIEGDTLHIQDCAKMRDRARAGNKTLRLEIPEGLQLDIEGQETEITIGILTLAELSVETTTGNLSAEKITCDKAEFETQYGGFYLGELVANALKAEVGDGELKVGLSMPTCAEILSRSGDVRVFLLGGLGVKVRMDGGQGSISSKRPFVKQDGYYLYAGNQTARLLVKTGTGDLYIE